MIDSGGVTLEKSFILATGVQGVLDAAVGAGVEVATGARLTVVARVHLPEEGLAQNDGQIGVNDELVDAGSVGQIRDGEGSQGRRIQWRS